MITPRRTRLIRVPDLHTFRRIVAALAVDGGGPFDLDRVRSRLVVVPTRGSARQLRRTIENHALAASRAVVLPDVVTRDQLYERLWARLPSPPPRLSGPEREVMMHAAARGAAAAGVPPPFPLRSGLIAEMVRFYDDLRRQRQSVNRFEELLNEQLEKDAGDRGAGRMLAQTRFLAAAWRGYEQRRAEGGRADEHALRDELVRTGAADPIRHVVVTVGDWIADDRGLYPADFDLLTRLPGLEGFDLVATSGMLESGFHQRVHEWLPGIEEIDGRSPDGSSAPVPALLAPAGRTETPIFVSRDREEELALVARRIKQRDRPGDALDREAVVFKRPLPYLYLAPETFRGAGIPYQAFDALPLAAEPAAAALDVVVECVLSQFTRDGLVALLRSPHLRIAPEGQPPSREAIAALDRALSERRYLGELERLRQIAREWEGGRDALPALGAALAAAEALQPMLERAPAAVQVQRLRSFMTSFSRAEHPPEDGSRAARARAAIAGILDALAEAFVHDDRAVTIEDVAPDLRRWIGDETFVPGTGASGLQLVDVQAARYGEFDEAVIIGMIEGEWPERQRRDIFFPPTLLAGLGWPSEKDRHGAAKAAFVDLLRSPSRRVAVSTFTLDEEALVEPSSLLDEVGAAGLAVVEADLPLRGRVFVEEALSIGSPDLGVLDDQARGWASMRLGRTGTADDRYHGQAGLRPPAPLSVSAVETYLACPFKFFAQHVLRLEEEPSDEEVMDPRKQGRFIHAVFQGFFAAWQDGRRGAITPDNLDEARALFVEIVEEHVARLPDAEAALERTRLLGSSVAEGLAEAVFRMETERSAGVVERLLEYPLKGEFEFEGPDGRRRVALRGVADRIDLLTDGTIRLIDYKLSSAPSKARALQLPVYGLCAEQRLEGHQGRTWRLGEAVYVTFRGPRRVLPLFGERGDRDKVLSDAQHRLLDAVGGIERGAFPPTPTDEFLCTFCSFAAVCRKDYVGDV